jgi:hypothetical protein
MCREYWIWKADGQFSVSQIQPYAREGGKIIMAQAAKNIALERPILVCVGSVNFSAAMLVTMSVKL